MEKFFYNDDVLTVEVSTCETSPYFEINILDNAGTTVFTGMYNTSDDKGLAIELAKADYCKVREYRSVHKALQEFEDNNRFCCFSDEELMTLAWAFTHSGFEGAYPVLYRCFNYEIKLHESLGA